MNPQPPTTPPEPAATRDRAKAPRVAMPDGGFAPPGAACAAATPGTDRWARHRWPRWLFYPLAVAVTLAMLGVQMPLADVFGGRPLLFVLLMLFPILLSAMVGGLGPGLTATLCATLASAYAPIPPVVSLDVAAGPDLLHLGFLVVMGALVSLLSEQMHRARRRVEASRCLQSVALADIADGVVAVDARGRIGFLNPAAVRLTGRDERQALGRPVGEVVPLLDPDGREPLPWPLCLHEDSGGRDALLRAPEGEIPVRLRCAPIACARGPESGRVLVLHDLRDEPAAALRRERALFKQLIETLPDLVWLKDPHGVFLACNRRFERFLGVPEAAVLGRTDYDFMPRELADFFRDNDRAAVAAGHPVVNEEELRFADDGHREWVETIKTPMHDAAGGLIGVLGIARDITAARETTRALRDTEERMRLFIAHAPAALAMFDRDMHYLAVSRRWLDDYGLDGQAVIGRSHYAIFPEIGEPLAALHRRGLAGESLRGDDYRFERQDGSVRWVRWEMLPWRAADGAVGGIVIFTEDITARKEAETVARRNEERYRALVDQAADPYFVHDHAGRFVEVNRQACESTGYSRDELLGMGVLDLERDFDLAGAQRVWDAMQPGTPLTLLGHHRRKDGTVFPVEVHSTLLLVDDRRLYISLVRDLTERERAEQLLRTSERRFQDIARASADWIWEIDAEDRYTYVSEGVQTMLGYAPEELLGKTPFDLMPEAEALRVGQAFAAIAARREPFRDLDHVNRCQDGRLANVLTNGVPILDEGGRLLGYRGLDRDVTERRQLEQELARYREHLEDLVVSRTAELRHARAEAERLARVKGDFLANMSHEIRTPLNAVLGFARIGLRDSPADGSGRAFAQILAAGEHLLGVINDILDYSKIEAGKLGVEALPFELAAVVANAGAFVSGIAAQKGIGYSAVLAPDLPAWVLGDSQRLQQVLANLLSNAVKFTQAGEVRLEVSRVGDDIRFGVSDTGIGMSEEQRARLFTPFQQADGSTTRRFGGSGLGLAISRQLVVLMGGEIGVESTPAVGSTFRVRLPLPAAEPPRAPERTGVLEAPAARRLAGVRVLAAEDVEVNRLILEDLLLYEGAAVHFAGNGHEALALIERLGAHAFDIALMDVQMPEMDGYAATAALRRLAPRLPVIGLTAFALAEERARCLEAGMLDHVTKPIDPERLVAAIRRHLVQTAPPAAAGPGLAPGPDAAVATIVDWPGLMQRFGGRRAFVQRLAKLTVKSEADTPERLRQVARSGDARTLAFMAHGLKGVTGNLMAQSVYALARDTEQAAREESPERIRLARDLAAATEGLLAELAEWSARIESPS